jgi:hypothetical protein
MIDAEKLVEKFSGFITKEQAEAILKNEPFFDQKKPASRNTTLNVKKLLDLIGPANPQMKLDGKDTTSVNVKDKVYRIFNPLEAKENGSDTKRRKMILGEEGLTIALNIRGPLSDYVDSYGLERGDTIIIKNALVDPTTASLKSGVNTTIERVIDSTNDVIADYAKVTEDTRKIDIVGKILEIGQIRNVSKPGSNIQSPVASCTITDSSNIIDASFWGSSALATKNLKANDLVKIEFCDLKIKEGKLQLYANDDSRVLASGIVVKRSTLNNLFI